MLARPSRFRDRHRTAWRAAVRALGAKGLLPRTGTPNGARGGCCGPGADSAQPRRSRHGYPLDCEQRLQQRHQPPSRCGPRNSGSARGARRAGRAGLCQAQAWASRRTHVSRGPGGRERARAWKPIKTSAARTQRTAGGVPPTGRRKLVALEQPVTPHVVTLHGHVRASRTVFFFVRISHPLSQGPCRRRRASRRGRGLHGRDCARR
jgi:hypothetical protein